MSARHSRGDGLSVALGGRTILSDVVARGVAAGNSSP